MSTTRILGFLVGLGLVGAALWFVVGGVRPPDDIGMDSREDSLEPDRPPEEPRVPAVAAEIGGRVLDPDGTPVAGARVALWSEDAEASRESPSLPPRVLESLVYAASYKDRPFRIDAGGLPPAKTPAGEGRTDAGGAFRLRVSLGRAYRLSAATDTLSAGFSRIVRAGDRVDLRLSAGAALRGRVVDEGEAPVAGATLSLDPDGRTTASGADGAFEIGGLAPGPRTLRVRAEGHATTQVPLVLPPEGLVRTVRLSRGIAVDVLVEIEGPDDRDRPASGALVVFLQSTSGEVHRATTGADGRTRIPNLTPGVYDAVAHLEGAVPHSEWSLKLTRDRTFSFLLETEAISTILVLGPDGRPVADARFLLANADEEIDERVGHEVGRTDESGRFRFAFDDDAREVLWVTAPGYAAGFIEPDDPAEAEDITVVLRHGAALEGRVVDEQRQPIAGALVVVESDHDDAENEVVVTVRTDGDGRFRAENLLRGEVDVDVSADGFRPGDASLEAFAPGAPAIEIVLSRGLEIAGRVVDETGRGVAGVDVAAPGPSRERTRTDEEGAFRLGAISPRLATSDIRLELTRGELVWTATATVGRAALITVPAAVTLAGRVLAGDEDTPVPSFRIEVVGGDGRVRQRLTVSDASGAFGLVLPDEPGVTLRIRSEQHEPWTGRLETIAFAERERLEIRLETPARLRVTVIDQDGRPVPAARLTVESEDGGWSRTAITSAAGTTVVRGAAGPVRLVVMHRSHTAVEVPSVVLGSGRETHENVVLPPGGAARIRLLRNGVSVITSATRFRAAAKTDRLGDLCVLTARGNLPLSIRVEGRGASVLGVIRPQTEGDALVLRGLPSGAYSVEAASGSNRSASVSFQMVAGSTRTVDLDLGR